ncbi:MAG: ATP synthase subunit I [Syntrophobacteraceae bacterium]
MRDYLSSEDLVRRIQIAAVLLGASLSLLACLIVSWRAALGVMEGAAISILSFQVLKWQLVRAFQRSKTLPKTGGLFASYYVRFLTTLFVVFVVIYYDWADPIPFLVGLSVVVIGILVIGGQEFLVMLSKKGED